MTLTFKDIYEPGNEQASQHTLCLLYAQLAQRPPEAAISHKAMPSFEDHTAFVQSHPYEHWWTLWLDFVLPNEKAITACIGNAYFSHRREIGIFLDPEHRGQGYGEQVLKQLVAMVSRGPVYANVAPGNEASHQLFQKLGFKPLQTTYICHPVFKGEEPYEGHPAREAWKRAEETRELMEAGGIGGNPSNKVGTMTYHGPKGLGSGGSAGSAPANDPRPPMPVVRGPATIQAPEGQTIDGGPGKVVIRRSDVQNFTVPEGASHVKIEVISGGGGASETE